MHAGHQSRCILQWLLGRVGQQWCSVIGSAVLGLELSSLKLMGYSLLRANTLDACLSSLCVYDLSLDSPAKKRPMTSGLTVS